MKFRFSVLFIGVAIAIGYFQWNSSFVPLDEPEISAPIRATISDNKSPTSTPAYQLTSHDEQSEQTELHHWLDERSLSFSSFSESDQLQLKRKVNELDTSQIVELKKVSSSLSAPVNKRILSLYMLGETSVGDLAVEEFLTSELDLVEDAQPHSMDEATNGREKALRVMAIEQIIQKSKTPQEAIKRLTQLLPNVQDPWLKDFTERKIMEIQE